MTDDTKTTQHHITANELAGRDINKTYNTYPLPPSPMQSLIDKYEKEKSESPETKYVSDILTHYLSPQDGPQTIEGLAKKLKGTSMEPRLQRALVMKENAFKRLTQTALSESAQRIFEYAMNKTYHTFRGEIVPILTSDCEPHELDKALYTQLYKPIAESLLSDPLGIAETGIEGLVFLLTGNCHLKWDGE